jgi:uridine kinase
MTERQRVVALLGDAVEAVAARSPRCRVAIDGRDAVGKTHLADELAAELQRRGRATLRAGIDAWHLPRAVRHRQGADSAEGYYRDSFDLPALRAQLLAPLGPGGDGRIRLRWFDHVAGERVESEPSRAPDAVVLVFDGVFLLRPELREGWDLSIHLVVAPEVALERAVARDASAMGGSQAARSRYLARYVPGQERYEAACRPREAADVVLDNTDLDRPRILRRPDGA